MLIGATTENPFFEVNAPLLSRSTLWRLDPLSADELAEVVPARWSAEGAAAEPTPSTRWSGWPTATPGPRSARSRWPWPWPARARDGRQDVERARASRLQHYGEDDHYDQISALIKSIRGSDPDAGLYWLARMLDAGEDARFIARRLVILASEDVGRGRPAGPGGGRRRRPRRRVRGPARGPAQPGPGRRPPGLRPEVEPGDGGARPGHRTTCARAPRATSRPTSATPTTAAPAHRPRRGLRLPPRPPRRLRRPGVPTRRGGRQRLLRAERTGPRGGGGRAPAPLAARDPRRGVGGRR